MRNTFYVLITFLILTSCSQKNTETRIIEDFNYDWKFNLGVNNEAFQTEFDDSSWEKLNVPHDWSIEQGYTKENTAASTGFVEGGIGWYRKDFSLNANDKGKQINILFDGVYNNSKVWINGHLLGDRPSGYSSFSYNLTEHLNYNGNNVIAVKVDRTAYADSRWYTGSGIYRKVQLIKTSPLHVAQWGTQITTPKVASESAEILVVTKLENSNSNNLNNVTLNYTILDKEGLKVAELSSKSDKLLMDKSTITVDNPKLWGIENPNLYTLKTEVFQNEKLVDVTTEKFGIRSFNFDANKGFFLNGKNVKIKGVNLHHDAGAVGAAVPKSIWEYRIDKLKSIGVNAVRMAHNPHSVELMEVCDEKGILVMAEAFDEWFNAKGKNKVYIGDNAAKGEIAKSYPVHFNEWAERDLKDLIKRDFNHPSVFMWSIGNEIEWTFGHYSKTFNEVNKKSGDQGYELVPTYNVNDIKEIFDKNSKGEDLLAKTANQLVKWVKEVDTTRPTTCGSVLPSIGLTSGYGTAVDVYGFNYRASEYDVAHKAFPNLKILGTENWGAYSEWKAVKEREFVPGIFAWTGFAYLGEAGPWPRKGLNISFFDYAGFKTPRGHFFECLWKSEPKVYMVTTPAKESEFSFTEKEGWKFDMQYSAPPVWKMLRKWEWYKTYPKWKYENDEAIVVQTYTNCEEAELFLNGISLGKQKLVDVTKTDNILKWLVPYKSGELKVVGYNNGEKVDEYLLNTTDKVSKIEIESTKTTLSADGYDVAIITAKLVDEKGNLIVDKDQEIEFIVDGEVKNLGVDNGWEMNVQPHKATKVVTHNGKAIILIQSTKKKGNSKVSAKSDKIESEILEIVSE
ncbi:glycoside hydrolase family 2 TIM barrel-domain containing protein [Lutibacter sp. TH_r2]|uniref:sugar-binding domain-containing protein n=1 Tax=Lutibacter sp. TH_r2 TaxID=3082083 RepID=UPI00295376D4|nr:sugar-binding domain-containing protein [Lutibacter sp. TH_r2]MDV7185939.1 glycoside hydrolase family 2 TIM barrel-domain containing protein [Lutibacter sp. TH_r2]